MRFTVSKKHLTQALRAVLPGVATRATLPILAGVKIEATPEVVTIESTDLELGIRQELKDGVCVEETGAVLPSAKQLLKVIAAMPEDQVTLEAEEKAGKCKTQIRSSSRSVFLDSCTTEDWPRILDASTATHIGSVGAADLSQALPRVALCASQDEARPVLTSVALFFQDGSRTLEVVATDSYRLGAAALGLRETPDADRTLLIPGRVAKAVAKRLKGVRGEVRIGVTNSEGSASMACFEFDSSTWSTHCIEGEFPNWRQLIPEETGGAADLGAEEIAGALKAVEAVASGGRTPVRLSLGETCALSLVEQDSGEIRQVLADARYSPDGIGEIEVAFNPGYLADAIRFCGTQRIPMWVRDGLKPVLMGTADHRYLLMPVRLS